MSAFVVAFAHVDAVLTAALALPYPPRFDGVGRLDRTTADAVGAALLRENVRSVRCRYPHRAADALPGPDPLPDPARYAWRPRAVGHIAALKLLASLEYQSCECVDWATTPAGRFCDALRRSLVDALPGYDDAPWELDDDADDPRYGAAELPAAA